MLKGVFVVLIFRSWLEAVLMGVAGQLWVSLSVVFGKPHVGIFKFFLWRWSDDLEKVFPCPGWHIGSWGGKKVGGGLTVDNVNFTNPPTFNCSWCSAVPVFFVSLRIDLSEAKPSVFHGSEERILESSYYLNRLSTKVIVFVKFWHLFLVAHGIGGGWS